MIGTPPITDVAKLRSQLMRALCLALIALSTAGQAQAQAQAQRPNLVPPGWTQEMADPETRTRHFVSPDGRSFMVTRQTPANRPALNRDMDAIAYRTGEDITYQRRASSWIAVSGYRGSKIFYRKSNLACGGTRWNHIELEYPRGEKLQMDDTVTYIARAMTAYGADCGSRRRQ
jgi:hypothetical protein